MEPGGDLPPRLLPPRCPGADAGHVRDGAVEAVHIQVASDNILHRYLPKMMHNIGMVAAFPLEGFLDSSPYVFENIQADWAAVDLPVPIGFWRSVGHSYSAYFMECFLDDIAVKLGQDPVLSLIHI